MSEKKSFNVGDKVYIVASSQYASQPHEHGAQEIGVVKELLPENLFSVRFPNISGDGFFEEVYSILDLRLSGIQIKQNTVKTEATEPKKISLSISRHDGLTHFKFAIDPRITKLYEQMSEGIKQSGKWIDVSGKGLEFYSIPSLLKDSKYKAHLEKYSLIDDYGASLYEEEHLNIAWLRTVGGIGELVVSEQIAFAEVSILIKQTITFLKEYFEEYYKNYTVSGELTVHI